jgi:thiosulfate/3-mercaptopyruvate sulfurtransferase
MVPVAIRRRASEARLTTYAGDVLVDTEWLAARLDDDSIRIVEVDEDPRAYESAHVPGAIGFDWRTDLQDRVRRDLLDPAAFAELMGASGISRDHTIVLYGDRHNWFAAYAFWYLRYYRHEPVVLLDGGRDKWIAEKRPTTRDPGAYPRARFEAGEPDDSIRAYRDEVEAAIGTTTRLVDVRTPLEFTGELIAMTGYEQEGAQRGGHIPGAVLVQWSDAIAADGTFLPSEELRRVYRDAGVIGDGSPVIAYCRIGERSAHTWFVLRELLGEPSVRNYDGSWAEWGNLIGVPIETGP